MANDSEYMGSRPYLVQLKRVYDPPSPEDGKRLLVDRLWPRGLAKEQAAVDLWWKEIAPSPELRRWFNHLPERFEQFKEKYEQELVLSPVRSDLVEQLRLMSSRQQITLLYAARDPVHNHAIVLLEWVKSGGR